MIQVNDIWSIIGLSSLVASVVTVILGIVKDIFVEKYRFKRQSQAGYIQSQIRLYCHIHFLLESLGGLGSDYSRSLFGKFSENVRELNEIMKKSSDLLEYRVLNLWLTFLESFSEAVEAMKKKKNEKERERMRQILEQRKQLLSTIKDIMNNKLIPEYRKIVGETVPVLE